MKVKDEFFNAFDALAEKGIKVRDITKDQMKAELKHTIFVPALFYQYRYLYKKERGIE